MLLSRVLQKTDGMKAFEYAKENQFNPLNITNVRWEKYRDVYNSIAFVAAGYEGIQAASIGAYLTASFHLTGLVASFSMGWLSDRIGRAPLLVGLAGVSTLCSFSFGQTLGLPLTIVFFIGMVYSFSGLGDSPILSTTLTESVSVSYMGAAFGLRSVLGFGAGAISPVVLGAVLDMTNPGAAANSVYTNWGWAFSTLGIGGLSAWLAALYYSRTQKKSSTAD